MMETCDVPVGREATGRVPNVKPRSRLGASWAFGPYYNAMSGYACVSDASCSYCASQ